MALASADALRQRGMRPRVRKQVARTRTRACAKSLQLAIIIWLCSLPPTAAARTGKPCEERSLRAIRPRADRQGSAWTTKRQNGGSPTRTGQAAPRPAAARREPPPNKFQQAARRWPRGDAGQSPDAPWGAAGAGRRLLCMGHTTQEAAAANTGDLAPGAARAHFQGDPLVPGRARGDGAARRVDRRRVPGEARRVAVSAQIIKSRGASFPGNRLTGRIAHRLRRQNRLFDLRFDEAKLGFKICLGRRSVDARRRSTRRRVLVDETFPSCQAFDRLRPHDELVAICVEVKILRRVRPPRHRRDACSMAWRCRCTRRTG